jgi:hypothetical protein
MRCTLAVQVVYVLIATAGQNLKYFLVNFICAQKLTQYDQQHLPMTYLIIVRDVA